MCESFVYLPFKIKYFSCLKMASVEPVTEQPEAALDVPPSTEAVSSSTSEWSSGLCGCFGDIGSCKYTDYTTFI